MYRLPYFQEQDNSVIMQFIADHPFATLIGKDATGVPVATHVPMILEQRDGELVLQGHIMRNTDHHKAFMQDPEVLAIFSGPHAYVSASWYSNPQIGSTWNYMVVHAAGTMSFMDSDGLVALMKKLTLHFESGNLESPTFFDNLPSPFLDKMLPAIVGIEIKVRCLDNVFKLSQNRDPDSYRNIMDRLRERGGQGTEVALEMEKRYELLFPDGQEWDASKFIS